MIIDDIIQAYEFVNKRTIFTNITEPISYEIPKIKGIHYGEYGKNIKEVSPHALKYIIYNLHNIDYSFLIESFIALFYYYKFRIKSKTNLDKVFNEVKNHYSILNEKKEINYDKGECLYLIEINIGSETLYKVGKTNDFNIRMKNFLNNLSNNYKYVSTSIKPLKVVYTPHSSLLEKEILNNIKEKKHKFYFNGHSESFKNIEIIKLFDKFIEKS